MDNFHLVKTNTAGTVLVFLLLGLLPAPLALAAHKRAAHSKPVADSGFHHYGYVCGGYDAQKGKNFAGSLTSASVVMQYMDELAHRQELPKGQALALVQSAKKADPAQRKADLKAFLDGYMDGWEKITLSLARLSKTASGSPSYRRYGANDPNLKNLHLLGVAVWLYLTDHDRTFPRMVSPKVADKFFQEYLRDDHAFFDPRTKQPYQPNLALQQVHLQSYQKTADTVVYYELNPEADGSRAVLFLDGTVAHIPADQWPALKQDSGIPDPQ